MTQPKRLSLYDRVAEETSGVIIRRYSTSFGLASRLLTPEVRQHIENIYALVRVADEIVDGGAVEAGVAPDAVAQLLDAFERETDAAMRLGYSTNLVIHAFALTARSTGFGPELTRPFFASMRADLSEIEHDAESFDLYVYGSAEVVGLMCLKAFLVGMTHMETDAAALVHGADKVRLLDDIDADLAASARVIPMLPASSRRAVALAQGLFAELSNRLRATPARELLNSRVRVPNPVKLRIAAVAASGRIPNLPKGIS